MQDSGGMIWHMEDFKDQQGRQGLGMVEGGRGQQDIQELQDLQGQVARHR